MTSIFTKIEDLFKSSGVETYLVTLGKTELKVAETSALGVAIKAAITAGEAGTTTVDKITLGIASLLPTVETLASDPSALVTDLETVARTMIEDVLAQIKSTGPLVIIEAIAAAL